MKNTLFLLFIGVFTSIVSQQTPAPNQTETITIIGATAHIGNGDVIPNSIISFENGKLTRIDKASDREISNLKGKVIHANGKHIYPAFIAPNSTLGLVEIDAVKATLDYREIGAFNPHIRSIVAYNPESRITETVRSNGVLIGQITPRGGYISGTSSVVQFDAWNYEDAILKEDDGVHLNWPSSFRRSGWWAQPGSISENKRYTEQTKRIADFFKNTKGNSETTHLKYNAIKGLFDGSKTLYIHVNGEKEIMDAIGFTNNFSISNVVLVGAFNAYKVMDLLKVNNISVILKRVHSLPTNEDQDIKLPYKLAKLLDDAGILVALDPAGDMERMNTRNLPFYAGTAVAYGLDYEKAIAMLTLNAAKILGLDKQIGSLEVGKDATLFISTGDALDMRTNNVEKAFINGRDINLDTHQKQLFRKFSAK